MTRHASRSQSPASTLAEIEARLKQAASGQVDIASLAVFEHGATGLRFRVGPMSRPSHEKWLNLRFVEEEQHRQSGGAEKEAPFIRKRSDEFLLAQAVWTEDGQRLPDALAKLLMEGEGFGPSTYGLLEAATARNPPRGALLNEVIQMWGATTTNMIFWRVCREAGLFDVLLDRLAGNPEEQAKASRQLKKVEETLTFWEGAFECERIAIESGFEAYGPQVNSPSPQQSVPGS
jgi:hypothetical protein